MIAARAFVLTVGLAMIASASAAQPSSAPVLQTTISPPAPPPPPGPPRPPVPVPPAVQKKLDRSKYGSARFSAFFHGADAIGKAAGFSGEMAMSFASHDRFGAVRPQSVVIGRNLDGSARLANQIWPLASITKQFIAVLVMQEVGSGRIRLGEKLGTYIPSLAGTAAAEVTVRQLLMHQSGLPNPDDSPIDTSGVRAFYKAGPGAPDPATFCAGPAKAAPGGNWSYNNCDYILVGELLRAVTGKPWFELVQERIAKPLYLTELGAFPAKVPVVAGQIEKKPEPPRDIARYGASGALYGSALELLRFDFELMQGKLLNTPLLAEMWDGKPEMGYIALGQWSFPAPLKGCAAQVRIIERRGAIGGIQVRNYILPEIEVAVVLFSDQGEFDFGEIWQGKGFAHDMLSLAACPQGAA